MDLDRLPAALRAVDPSITPERVQDAVREIQLRRLEQVYNDPNQSSPNRRTLLENVQVVDPKITGEVLDDWIHDRRVEILRRLCYDADRGFGSIEKTWRLARREDPWITREEVVDLIRKQAISQDMQRARRLGTFLATGALEQIEIDLADFSTKAQRGDRISMYGWEACSPVPATPSSPSTTSRRSWRPFH